MPLNSELFFAIYNLSRHNLVLDWLMIFGANQLIFLTFFLVFVVLILGRAKERKAFFLIIIGVIFVEIVIKISHLFFLEARPFVTFHLTPLISNIPDAAFPSEHTSIAAVLAFANLFCKSKFTPLFFLSLLWIGFARIYVGVHYPLDILGGIVVGFIGIYLAVLINRKIKLF